MSISVKHAFIAAAADPVVLDLARQLGPIVAKGRPSCSLKRLRRMKRDNMIISRFNFPGWSLLLVATNAIRQSFGTLSPMGVDLASRHTWEMFQGEALEVRQSRSRGCRSRLEVIVLEADQVVSQPSWSDPSSVVSTRWLQPAC